MAVGAPSAGALTAAPHWTIESKTLPTHLATGGSGNLLVLATNNGGRPTLSQPVTITVTLPPGVTVNEAGKPTEAFESPQESPGLACEHTTTTVTCTIAGGEPPLPGDNTAALEVRIPLAAEPGLQGTLVGTAAISGGGAPAATANAAITVSAQEPTFGLDGTFEAGPFDAVGTIDTQAAGHPNTFATSFLLNTRPFPPAIESGPLFVEPVENPRDVVVDLPVGFIGNPQAAPTCPQYLIAPPQEGVECPAASVVGTVALKLTSAEWELSLPHAEAGVRPSLLFNVPPEHGHPAQFAFTFDSQEVTLYTNLVHTADGYVVRVTSPSIPRGGTLEGAKVTIFGDPAIKDGGSTPSRPFLTNPSDCSATGPRTTTLRMDSRQNPGTTVPEGGPEGGPALSDPAWKTFQAQSPPLTGCNLLQFRPSLSATLDTAATGSPTGLKVDLKIPQNEDPEGLATPPLKDATVTLPRGLVLSPSSANGLQACSDQQIALETTAPASCPDASVLATVNVHTPILAEPLEGQLFLGSPLCSPCSSSDAQNGRLVRLFLEVKNATLGIDVKIAGATSIDPATGQLTASFPNDPQFPFDELQLKLKSGPRAALTTPSSCGTYISSVDLTPWSAPYTPDAILNPEFQITEGCAAPGFAPSFLAGTTINQAGAFSPFVIGVTRGDGEQPLKGLSATLPPGVSAKLAGVPECADAQASTGTCPESSRIGTVTVAAGPGTQPYVVKGGVYLTGPYNGGAFGDVVEVPAVAGPFNLGQVNIRGSIRINPATAQASAVSDPFPTILDGIPLQIKTISVSLDRPSFTFNASSCAPSAVAGTLASSEGAQASVSTLYQAAGCATLAFKPVFAASTSGRSSKAAGASLDVKISSRGGPQPGGGEANIAAVKVDLPLQLPSRLTTLQKACVAKIFEANPASCAKESDVGTAMAITPLLANPLSGPAYLVSHGGAAFPDLEIVLQGEGVTLVLDGKTNIKKGVTSSSFNTVPDAPISSFELKLPTGKFSVLGTNLPGTARYNFCGQKLVMPTKIVAQNGAVIKQTTKIGVTGCPKAKKARKAATRAGRSTHTSSGRRS